MYKWYLNFLCTEFKKIKINTVKDLLKNVFHINEFKNTAHIQFTEKEIEVLIHLATEWLHYQLLPKVEIEDDVEPA